MIFDIPVLAFVPDGTSLGGVQPSLGYSNAW